MSAQSSDGTGSMDDAQSLLRCSALELAKKVREKAVSAREVAEVFVTHSEAVNSSLNAAIRIDRTGAMKAADETDRKIAAGEDIGMLAGVPVGLKDIFVTKGLETTCGSKILEGWIPPYEGTPSQKMRDMGATIVAKLNMDEFAMGSSNENSAYGICHNPWDISRVPGGSSGGSAAAVSARMCAISLGTDTGGSIRQPAALCGVVGMKPTYGRVSRYGVIAFASSLDQVGPFGNTVADCALGLQTVAGYDPKDATSVNHPVGNYVAAASDASASLKGVRLGVPKEYFQSGSDPEVDAAVKKAIDAMVNAGAEAVDLSMPHTEYGVATYYLICTAEASSNLSRFDGVRFGHRLDAPKDLSEMYEVTREVGFGDEVKRRIILGTFALSSGYYDAYYGRAQKVRSLVRQDFNNAFEKCDIVVSPTSPSTAFKVGERSDDPLQMYLADVFTISCNLAGLPGMSLPCGLSTEGLPIGLQMISPAFEEERLFRCGAAYERLGQWTDSYPPIISGKVQASKGDL